MEKRFEEETAIPALQDTVVDRQAAADILQNDINQTLTAVLLWLQSAMEDEPIASNQYLQLAESNLKSSIKKLVTLHYALLEK